MYMSPEYGAHKPKEKTFPHLFSMQSTADFSWLFRSSSPTDSFSTPKALPVRIIFGVGFILKNFPGKISTPSSPPGAFLVCKWGDTRLGRGEREGAGNSNHSPPPPELGVPHFQSFLVPSQEGKLPRKLEPRYQECKKNGKGFTLFTSLNKYEKSENLISFMCNFEVQGWVNTL